MFVTAEIGYYPLAGDYRDKVSEILREIGNSSHDLHIVVQPMSTLISGDYDKVLERLGTICKRGLESGSSVFSIRISNACPHS